ncbi:MAG: hypothetical protein IAE66_06325 [Xanthomonadaceae bacterium]|nr:hypothetical protein [Xanthomonadaceae bacterium]
MKVWLKVALVALATMALAGAAWLGSSVPFAQQWPIYEGLRTTAAIIFAVVGAWLAIAYPERLRVSLRREKQAELGENPNVVGLLTPIAHSTIILAIVLLVGVVAPAVKSLDFIQEHLAFFRGASYVLVCGLTLWQVCIVILTLVPADVIKRSAEREAATQARVSGMFDQTSRDG